MSRFRFGAKPILGLVGAIGAGKTAVAGFFAVWGARVIDADALGHMALEQPHVKEQVKNRWGEKVFRPDGNVNRREVAKIVFANLTELKTLEAFVFPVIAKLAREDIQAGMNDSANTMVVLDAAVLYEAGWAEMCDKVLFVDAPRELRLQRVAARSQWTEADLTMREAAQWPLERKRALADGVVNNDGTREKLKADVLIQATLWGFPIQDDTPQRERHG